KGHLPRKDCRMMKGTKTTVVAGVAALVLAGAGAGVAFAQTPDPSPSPTPSGSPAPQGPRHGHGEFKGGFKHGGFGAGGLGGGGFLGRIEHAEATVDTGTNNTTQVVDVQRGTVDSVDSGTLTVHSADGFSATYTVDSSTKISKNRQASDISQVAVNDQ